MRQEEPAERVCLGSTDEGDVDGFHRLRLGLCHAHAALVAGALAFSCGCRRKTCTEWRTHPGVMVIGTEEETRRHRWLALGGLHSGLCPAGPALALPVNECS